MSTPRHRHGRHGHPTIARSKSEQAYTAQLKSGCDIAVEQLTAAENASVSALCTVYTGWWDSINEAAGGAMRRAHQPLHCIHPTAQTFNSCVGHQVQSSQDSPNLISCSRSYTRRLNM